MVSQGRKPDHLNQPSIFRGETVNFQGLGVPGYGVPSKAGRFGCEDFLEIGHIHMADSSIGEASAVHASV